MTLLGHGSLTGRAAVRPPNEDIDFEPRYEPHSGPAIPASCLRVLSAIREEACPGDCVGRQADGGCLCTLVRSAQAQGKQWRFEIDPRDDSWVYAGDPLD